MLAFPTSPFGDMTPGSCSQLLRLDGHQVSQLSHPRKLRLSAVSSAESDDDSTELTSSEGSDDESRSSDASPVVSSPPFSRDQTLVIFDWDDTLMPTSWLQRHGYRHDGDDVSDEEHLMQLQALADAALESLRIAHQFGRVVIVTNATAGWVQVNCKKFLPSLFPALDGFDIVSAQSTYKSEVARDPVDWKKSAFMHEVKRYYGKHQGNLFWNVIALGDAMYEQQALSFATSAQAACHAKFVKFVERPDVQRLTAELEEVNLCFGRVVDHDGDLNLCVPGRGTKPDASELTASIEVQGALPRADSHSSDAF